MTIREDCIGVILSVDNDALLGSWLQKILDQSRVVSTHARADENNAHVPETNVSERRGYEMTPIRLKNFASACVVQREAVHTG